MLCTFQMERNKLLVLVKRGSNILKCGMTSPKCVLMENGRPNASIVARIFQPSQGMMMVIGPIASGHALKTFKKK
ncbi:hypothetical protein PVAP13_7NG346850 [Panicum virgatum]|uniref:Uncharacterized protein n=1 Tax=Panicum virgatum TaxID=38727 RepID=A0A8T0Q383_PANVG|nr:hypothetical protein PVAP13_7NG346850 [Panicum virgatum]